MELADVSLDDVTEMAPTGPVAPSVSDEDRSKIIEGPPIGASIYFDNTIDLHEEICDAETGESVLILFGFVTTKNIEGDDKLEQMSGVMAQAGVFYHSYDAKSGSDTRITRIGATKTRLEHFADAIDYVTGLDAENIEKECKEAGLILANPKNGQKWYKPYEHLSGAYEVQKKHLYTGFTDGDYIKLLFLILVGSTNFKDAAKGCGFDITKLNSSEADDAFCLAIFPLHDNEAKQKLSDAWLPLDWPWKLPTFQIKEYFGEEIAFYFGFLAHITSGLLPMLLPALICAKYMRAPREFYSFVLSSSMIFALVICVGSIFLYKSILVRTNSSQGMLLVPALLNAVQITIFGIVYGRVATFMTDYENHKTVSEHNSALFKKLTLFYFVNNYATLFYIAFIKSSFEGCIDPFTTKTTYCGLELSMQVAVVFLVNDFMTRVATSLVLPWALSYYAKYQAHNNDSMKAEDMGPIERQYVLLSPYAPSEELILDYIELFIQWGYLVLFGASFPLVVLFACFTNYVETRTDGFKLLRDFRRVVPNRVDGIGEPLAVFYYTLFSAVPVNAGLVVYTFKANPFHPNTDVWVFIAISIFIVLVIGRLDAIYPDVPLKTQIQLGREERIFDRIILGNEGRIGDLKLDLSPEMIGLSVKQVKAKLAESAPVGTKV